MDNAVISQRMVELIGERRVLCAVFTTYTFEPDFFELEVIPLLLDRGLAYSSDDEIKRFTVRENLRLSRLKIDVFFDQPMFITSGDCSPQMEYGCHGVTVKNGAFHPKTLLLLLENPTTKEKSILHGAGSNNLSRAGWWDNIECVHWCEYSQTFFPNDIKLRLQDELTWLSFYFDSGESSSAALQIDEYLKQLVSTERVEDCFYFPYSTSKRTDRFITFLNEAFLNRRIDDAWTLEIISPFFADNDRNTEHRAFLDAGIERINLLLPLNELGQARCTADYFQWITQESQISWASWREDLSKRLGTRTSPFRNLHAKVYHIYNKAEAWVFVGSVNFTHKALNDNCEAGYLVKLQDIDPLLEPLQDSNKISSFESIIEPEPNTPQLDAGNLAHRPSVRLLFDWKTKTLRGRLLEDGRVKVDLFGVDDTPLLYDCEISSDEIELSRNLDELARYLERGGFVDLEGIWVSGVNTVSSKFPRYRLLVVQKNWTHKPLDLPLLTAAQIISIYAGISDEQRTLILQSVQIQKLINLGYSLTDTDLSSNEDSRNFFSEYAEIFNGFNKLRASIRLADKEQRWNDLDYYLTGTGVDSLPTLVSKFVNNNETLLSTSVLEPVTQYLILLCIEEILKDPVSKPRSGVHSLITRVRAAQTHFEQGEHITLTNRDASTQLKFFEWYRAQFIGQTGEEEEG